MQSSNADILKQIAKKHLLSRSGEITVPIKSINGGNMAQSTSGIITKKVSCEEIIAAVKKNYRNVKDDDKATDDFVILEFKAGRYTRDLRIIMNSKLKDSEKSGEEYGVELPDNVTFLTMTYLEDSPKIMKNIVSQFGGYVRDDDYDGSYYEVELVVEKGDSQ
jgi:hypothetical protein